MTLTAQQAVLAALAALAGLVIVAVPASAQPARNTTPTDQCASAYNAICEDPSHGGPALCAPGTDRADCTGRVRRGAGSRGLFGYDDRQLMNTAVQPWSLIGRLEFDDGRGCSGVLIDERTVLSAAHCVLNDDGLAFAGAFITARDHPGGPFRARVTDAHVLSMLADEPELDGLIRRNIDWALLRLDSDLGAELGYLPVEVVRDNRPRRRDLISGLAMVIITIIAAAGAHGRTRAVLAALAIIGALVLGLFGYRALFGYDPRTERLQQAGYSWDTGIHLSGDPDCQLLEFRHSGLIGHDCDTLGGDSGSPILVRRGDGWAVIGVVSHTRIRFAGARDQRGRPMLEERAYAVSAARVPDPEAIFGPAPQE